MNAKSRIAAAALFAAWSLPSLAADPRQSAITGDPFWPPVAEVAPRIALQQGQSKPAATEVEDPTWPSWARQAPTALTLRQEPLRDDPLQPHWDASIQYAVAAGKSAPEASRNATAVVCATSCKCPHG